MRWLLVSPFLLCSHRISLRVPALPAQEAQTLPGWFKIKPYAVSKTNEEAVRAKAGTGLKPPKPEPLVSPADLISPSARAPQLQQPGEATGGPGEEVNWCDRSRDMCPSLEEKPGETGTGGQGGGPEMGWWDGGEGCWTFPAYQGPSFLQTAGNKTPSEPRGIDISPIHPARRSHSGQSHLRGEQDHRFQQAFLRGSLLPIPSQGGGAPGCDTPRLHLQPRAPSLQHCGGRSGGCQPVPEGFGSG